MSTYALHVNNKAVAIEADAAMPLLYTLRDRLGLNGPNTAAVSSSAALAAWHIDAQVE